jgi:hypothetical protein
MTQRESSVDDIKHCGCIELAAVLQADREDTRDQ